MTRDFEDEMSGELRADLVGSVNMLIDELTEDGYEYEPEELDELETQARGIADLAEELAHRYRIGELEAEDE